MKQEIKLADGKYNFVLEHDKDNFKFYCLRYGEQWMELGGNKAVLELFYYAMELKDLHEKTIKKETL